MAQMIIVLDFDGVVHSYTSPWEKPGNIPDPPVPGAMGAICDYLEDGFRVAIYSSRSKSLSGRWSMKRWLRGAMAVYLHSRSTEPDPDVVLNMVMRQIEWPLFKPPAFVTIDDRAICFDGTWPSGSQIRSFKPWNKK